MRRAAQSLRERNTGVATQQAEQKALRRYNQLIEALKPRKKPPGGQQQGGQEGGGSGGGSGGQQQQDSHSLAELVLIKLMQEDVSARTKELDATRKRGSLTPAESEEFQRLGEEQGKLADMLLDLMGGGEPQPDDLLPEIKLDDLKSDDAKSKPKEKP
jgi:hypothetical protein